MNQARNYLRVIPRENEITPSEFAKHRFFRAPAWRHERAMDMLNGKATRSSMKEEDPGVAGLHRFHRHQRRLSAKLYTERESGRRLMTRYPEIFVATEIFENKENPCPRASIEANILAGQSDYEIGEYMRVPEELITAYRELYYDVADRLESIDYIAGYVIGPVFQAGLDAHNPGLLARYFGYFIGELCIPYLLYGATKSGRAQSDHEAIARLERHVQTNLKLQASFVSTSMLPGRFDIPTVIEGYSTIVKMEQDASDAAEEQTWISGMIDVFRDMNVIPRGMEEVEKYEKKNNIHFDQPISREPRAHELNRMATDPEYAEQVRQRVINWTPPNPNSEYAAKIKAT